MVYGFDIMQCTKPIRIYRKVNKFGRMSLNPSIPEEGLLVPCGKCLACRIAKRREWSIRMLHELSSYDDAVFLTLTYKDDCLPPNGSLVKADLQKFFKRLRKRLDSEGRKIRYFACGEYGDYKQRPHYHAIVFGLSLRPTDKQLVKDSWRFCDWSNGAICKGAFGMVEPDSIRYVAQYIDKKFSGDLAEVEYVSKGREPVFKLSSLGLGRDYCDKNSDVLARNLSVSVNGVLSALPRYYIDRLGLSADVIKEHAVEADCSVVEHYTGISDLTRDEAYRVLKPSEVRSLEDGIKAGKLQHDKNLKARNALKKRKL